MSNRRPGVADWNDPGTEEDGVSTMKGRESGMPEERSWEAFFNPA